MKLLRILRTETASLLLMGFVVGAFGLAATQPGTAQAETQLAASTR